MARAPDSSYETPKRDRETEQLLRQFLTTDGPKGASDAYREGWERCFGSAPKVDHTEPEPPNCSVCAARLDRMYVKHRGIDYCCDCYQTAGLAGADGDSKRDP